MGIDFKKAPPLPAPTETESTIPTELGTDVSYPIDQNSTYSLPEDGTPVTIKTHGRSLNQKTLLIEYTENPRPGASGSDSERRPSVRVRVTNPSSRGKSDAVAAAAVARTRVAETDALFTPTYNRRRPISPLTGPPPLVEPRDLGDDRSIGSYASATEESNVSRHQPSGDTGQIIGRNPRRRRPASPLIPSAHGTETMASYMPSTQSEISAIPTDSFLDGSGPVRSPEARWMAHPPSSEKLKSSKTRTVSRERVKISEKSSPRDRSDRKHKSSKSRTSSISDKHGDSGKSPRRRSSRNHDSIVSGADSSAVSSSFSPSHRSMDQHSMRSESSSKSINNPKLLEAVEDAIRRLILPQLDSLRREQSIREARRGSVVSAATSVSREDLAGDRRRLSDRSQRDSRHKDRRDREARHDFADASYDRESMDGSSILEPEPHTPRRRSTDMLKAVAAAGAVGGLAGAALAHSPSEDKKQRRRKRAESTRSRSRASDTYTDDFDDDDMLAPAPPMPLMSEINPSDVTRTSILSADTDRPHSASEEMASLREVPRGVAMPPASGHSSALPQGLGMQHANISHGDLTALRNVRADVDQPSPAHGREPPSSRSVNPEGATIPEVLEDELPPDSNYVSSAYEYYNTQDVPQHLRYEPYQPERRGLSPIYSVSGYTEGGSEGPHQRDSRGYAASTTSDSPEKPAHSMHSPASAHSHLLGRDLDQRSDGRSSVADYRRPMSMDEADPDPSSRQAVRGIGANPDIVHVPMGLESHVASLVDGSMIEQSVLSQDYGQRDSMASYDDMPRSYRDNYSASPTKQSQDSRHYTDDDRALTPVSRGPAKRSHEFSEEYDIDKHGRKVPQSRYRQSTTEAEAAITSGAALKAIMALKAKGLTDGAAEEAFTPAGVQRNKSFKERTLAGHEPATTPTHSVDRLDYVDEPRFGASGLPDLNDPMPEIGYVDDSDTHTNASVVEDRLDGNHGTTWSGRSTPKAMIDSGRKPETREAHGLGITDLAAAGALGAAAAMASNNQSRQASNEHVEEPPRTSDEKKRDTLGTNPFEGISPVANPHLGENLFQGGNYSPGFHTGSPGVEDEGYKSQGPNRTPDFETGKGNLDVAKPVELRDGEDPFFDPTKSLHTPNFSGMSHGMVTPFYDAATGGGIDRIESKDIIALMQELVARDAQRTARDTEIAATVMFLAQEMRMSFQNVETRIKQAEDVLVDELEHTEKAIIKTIGGPRPYPGSAGRSVQGGSQAGEDLAAKKGNIIRRALKGLRTSGTNDLTRIEDMLLTLLKDVDDLKAQTAQQPRSTARPSLDNLQPETQYEQDQVYEQDARDAPSLASHGSQSGHLAAPRSSQRRLSENRVSTVPEALEEDHDDEHGDDHLMGPQFTDSHLMTPAHNQRGSSVPLDTPPQATTSNAHLGSVSNENTPRTDKGKKHKSGSSSSWIPKISRWSETTASTVSKAFRGSGATLRKDRDAEYVPAAHSRSGSDLGAYADDYHHTDPYGDDHLHTGFSDLDLVPPNARVDDVGGGGGPPRAYMTPEDPKYKAHRNSLNLQHPQPRPGQTERFKATLESQAHIYDSTMTPRSHDWRGSTASLHRSSAQHGHRYSDVSARAGEDYWPDSPGGANAGPPRPPKEPLDSASGTPVRGGRSTKLQKASPLPYHSVESGYGTATATHTNYTGSPKLENRNLSGALGAPTRRPSGPRAMTPKSPEEEAAREERRRKRDTFGTIASQDTDTF